MKLNQSRGLTRRSLKRTHCRQHFFGFIAALRGRSRADGAWHLLVRALMFATAKTPIADEAMPGTATPAGRFDGGPPKRHRSRSGMASQSSVEPERRPIESGDHPG